MSLIYTSDSSVTRGSRNRLYIGGRSDAKNREKLLGWGVSHILNVTPAKDAGIQSGVPNFFEKDRTFVYKRVPVYDTSTSATELLSHADDIVDFITRGLFHGAVLVHCNMGQSRSTTAALFFLLRKANMSLNSAMELVKRRRPDAEPISAFREILETYEARCIKERELDGKQGGNSSKTKKRMGQSAAPTPSGGGKEDNNNQESKRKRVVGPAIGPSIGPSTGPSTVAAAVVPTTKVVCPIGPSLPPKFAASKKSIGPSLPTTETCTTKTQAGDDNTSSKQPEPKSKSIGSSLPPPS